MSSSKNKGHGDDSPSAEVQKKQQLPTNRVQDVFKLMRIRDFLSQILSYPMRIGNENYVEKWINKLSEFRANYLARSIVKYLLSKNPLRHVEELIPENITREIRNGGSFIFSESKSDEPAIATSSTNQEEQLKQPEPILDLATHLAVHQLTQTLTDGQVPKFNVQNVWFSTRNDAEKQTVVKGIKANFQIGETFQSLLVFDFNEIGKEFEVLELARWLDQTTIVELQTIDFNVLLAGKTERHQMVMNKSHRHLVLLVNGDGDKKLEPRIVHFVKNRYSTDVVVFITTESSAQKNEELAMKVDLGIRTEDHVLPWEVFCKNVGIELIRSSNDIQRIAVQVVEKCGGHLLAILLVAKSLKDVEDVELWKLALEKLRYPNLSYKIREIKHVSEVMMNAFINIIWADEIFEREKPHLTRCLRCLIFQDSVMSVNELFFSWYFEELVDSQEKAEHTLRELVERSILLRFEGILGRYILLPEEIIIILEALLETNTYWDLNEGALRLTESPKVLDWLGVGKTPISFFQLKVLDLSCTSIHDLPGSFCYLVELREFYLKDCELFMELPPEIGKLKNLKKLDLDGTQITHLPIEIQELTNLESLSLSFSGYHGKKYIPYSESAMIPLGILSKLTHLKDLRIDVNPENVWWHENVEDILAEIVGLMRLQTLYLYVPQVKFLKLVTRPLRYFRFIAGHHMQRIISRVPRAIEVKFKQSKQSFRFINGVDFPNEVKNILQHAMALFLDRHMTINNLSQLGLENLWRLKLCILSECNEMESIVDLIEESCLKSLSSLEFLAIFYMKNLRSIVNGSTPLNYSFFRLKFFALHTCSELTTIFTKNLLYGLSNLEELIVEDCPKVSSMVSCQSWKQRDNIFLPRLRKLSLLYLPELVSISNGFVIGRDLEKIGFYYCPKLESLSTAEMSSKSLKVIRGETKWWEALKWSKAEWGQNCHPDHFNRIFLPIDEEADVLTQLTTEDMDDYLFPGFSGKIPNVGEMDPMAVIKPFKKEKTHPKD